MDSVRFGRALGIGARHAAKTLVTAVDAATAPNPSPTPIRSTSHPASAQPPTAPRGTSASSTTATTVERSARTAARSASDLRHTTRGIAQGSRRFGQAAWGPVVKLSGVLWLEFTGVFFGLFALFAGGAAWKLRDSLHRTASNAEAHTHLQLAVGMMVIFGYFCLSSFLRASRRGRRP